MGHGAPVLPGSFDVGNNGWESRVVFNTGIASNYSLVIVVTRMSLYDFLTDPVLRERSLRMITNTKQ